MLLQHRHYAALAANVKARLKDGMGEDEFNEFIRRMTVILRGTNPNFDEDRFCSACKGQPINWRDRP